MLETTRSAFRIAAKLNLTNPTNYSAIIPYVNVHLLSNGTLLGNATAKNVKVVPGHNDGIAITANWDPLTLSGERGAHVGKELLSQYISGVFILISPLTSRKLRPE